MMPDNGIGVGREGFTWAGSAEITAPSAGSSEPEPESAASAT